MARNELFGDRTKDDRVDSTDTFDRHRERSVDRDRDSVDDRTENFPAPTAVGNNQYTSVAARSPAVGRDGFDDRTGAPAAPLAPAGPVAPAATTAPVAPVAGTSPVPTVRARASMLATLGLMLGLLGAAAALSGRLAPVGIALGVLGVLLSLGGVVAGSRPNVAGGGLGSLGLVFSVAAIVFAVLAMTNTASWLDSDVDQVARLRDWLDQQMPWLRSW